MMVGMNGSAPPQGEVEVDVSVSRVARERVPAKVCSG